MYDLFVSYHWRDHEAVEAVAQALRKRSLQPFLDRWYLVPGRSWIETLENTLRQCKGVVIFLGPNGMGRWQQREKELAIDRQVQDPAFFVIPVLLPGADPALGFLSLNTWVDLRNGTTAEAIEILVRAVRGEPPTPELKDQLVAALAGICPYRGLRPFREEDEPFFCGRETFAETLERALQRRSLIAVVGASGSGKSSVLRAGLIPRLRRKTDHVWEVVTTVPQERPFYSIAAALQPLLEPELSEVDRLVEIAKLAEGLEQGALQLRPVVERVLERQPGTDKVLLAIDQWEELYTLCRDERVRQSFISQILDIAASERISAVLTLRGDFYGHALADRELSDRMQDGVVNVGPMTHEELRRAIEEPAKKVGLRFEDGLIDRILDELGQEPGNLPLLEFLLTELWDKRRAGELLHEAYNAIGGVRRAISERAEQAFAKLSEHEQDAAHWALLALVVPGQGADDTRRRAVLQELGPLARAVITKLATDRLLVTARDALGRDIVEVGHEALIREWKRLREWVNEDREFLKTLRRLEEETDFWLKDNYDPDLLLPPGRRLVEASELLDARPQAIGAKVKTYIIASREAEQERQNEIKANAQRQLARTRKFAAAVSVLLLAAITSAGLFWIERRNAGILTEKVEHNFKLALNTASSLVKETARYRQSGEVISSAASSLLKLAERTLGDLNQLHAKREFGQEIAGAQVSLLLAVADAYTDLGDTQTAIDRASRANGLARELVRSNPNGFEWQHLLYGSYFRIGDALAIEHKHDLALEKYEAAREIADNLAKAPPQSAKWANDQVFIYSKVGDALRAQGKLPLARTEYDRALAIAERLARSGDESGRHAYAATLNRIGQVLVDQCDLRGALDHYTRALEVSAAIARDDPNNLGRQFTLAVRLSRMGTVLKLLNDPEPAVPYYRRALQIRKQLVDDDRNNAVFQDHLGSSYADVGEIFERLRKFDDAVIHYTEALRIRESLERRDPKNANWRVNREASAQALARVLSLRSENNDEVVGSIKPECKK